MSALPGQRRMPKVVVFDLDYTSWPLYVDSHVSSPIKRREAHHINLVHDRYGTSMGFYPDVPAIFMELHHADVYLAVASRTGAVSTAKQALSELRLEGSHKSENDLLNAARPAKTSVSAIRLFDQLEIYPGSKIAHFKAIHKKTGIPYKDMVFFDDEYRNREVASLGVTFVLVEDGVTRQLYEDGLETWRRNRGA